LFEFYIGYEGTIQAYALALLFSIIGIAGALILYRLKRYMSLGFLIGGFSTFLAVILLPSSP